MNNINQISSLIWSIADDVLRGTFKPNEYGRIILPFVVLRRLDCVLEQNKDLAIKTYDSYKDKIDEPEDVVLKKLQLSFYNISKYDFKKLKSDPTNIKQNFENYIQGYSENVRDIVKNFNLQPLVDKLNDNDKLYLLIDKYTTIDLHPDTIDNHQMGTIYEELLRKFSEMTNEESGDHFTPRDIVQLLVALVFGPDKDSLQGKGLIRTIYDPCCGTGGLLSIGKQWVKENINSDITLELFGQELNDQTYATCKSDQLISGENPENIKGPDLSTLSQDQFINKKFDYIIANPPYNLTWKNEKEKIEEEFNSNSSRFIGLPPVNDGSLLFLQIMIDKMSMEGSRLGVVLNGTVMANGKVGSGSHDIRKWILENDLLETIIRLPRGMFFNTPIHTYIWIISNKKEEKRKNKIQLIDASKTYEYLRKNLNEKNKEFSQENIDKIYKLYNSFEEGSDVKIKNRNDFFVRQVKITGIPFDDNSEVYKSNETVSVETKLNDLLEIFNEHFKEVEAIEENNIGAEIYFNKEFFNFNEYNSSKNIKKQIDDIEKIKNNISSIESIGKKRSKEVGINWLPKVQDGWTVLRTDFLFKNEKIKNDNLSENNLLSLTLNGVVRKNIESNEGLRPENYSTYQIVNKDDLVFKLIDLENIQTSRVGIVPEKGIISSAYLRLVPNKELIYPKYAYWYFYNLYKKQIFNKLGSDTVRSSMGVEELKKLYLPVPSSLEEQIKISNLLDNISEQINADIDKQRIKIDLLNEFKNSILFESFE